MGKSRGRRQFTFTLYENNEKDSVVIKLLEKIPQSARGKVIRGVVLDAFADLSLSTNGRGGDELGMLETKEFSNADEDASNKTKEYAPQKSNLQEVEESEKDNKSNNNNDSTEETDDINPFNGLNV